MNLELLRSFFKHSLVLPFERKAHRSLWGPKFQVDDPAGSSKDS